MDHRERQRPDWIKDDTKTMQIIIDGLDGEIVRIPAKYEVCPTCDGKGTHVNPSIDGHGITGEEMDELGHDWLDDYLSGAFDVVCNYCKGVRVVLEVDREAALPRWIKLYDEMWNDEWETRRAYEAERRVGA